MKIALFDVDGTILNSMGAWDNLGRRFLRDRGIDTGRSINNDLFPLTSLQSASYLKNHYHLSESIQEILEAFHKDLHDYYVNDVQLKDGIIDVLEAFKKQGYHLYVTTTVTRELVNQSFKRLNIDHYFDGIYTCDGLGILKNDPAFYKIISNKLNENPQNIIVFEDNLEAVHHAKKLGMKVVGIYDKHSRENLEDQVDTYITNWEELL